jgi:hypothetical protein
MQTYVKPEVAFVNDLTQAFLFSTAMSVPATRFLKILRIFNTQVRFLTQIIDKALTKEINQHRIIYETSTTLTRGC